MGFERVAIVTGAARGIGAATVRALSNAGYGVTALDACGGFAAPSGVHYPMATADDLARLVADHPDRILPQEADVRDPHALEAAVAATVERFGRLDVAVAAAGVVAGGKPLWETPVQIVRTLLEVNLIGVWNTAAATIPVMLANPDRHGCRFVAVSSSAGERGLYHLGGYGVSKHAVNGLVRSLAADLAGTGVTAVAVAPGSTRTSKLEATAELYGTTAEDLAQHQRIRRLIEPEEIAASILHCCSREGGILNGSILNTDGGFAG